jgi:preprotein translocase subunit Sec61beta
MHHFLLFFNEFLHPFKKRLNISTAIYFIMARSDRISAPSSMGGIVRYFDEYKSKYQISPQVVVILVIVTVLLLGVIIPLMN